ncbi:MAG: hypothetical protein QXH53_04145 [Nitrososphaerales archaeon]
MIKEYFGKVNKPLILLALRAKFKGLEASVSDYHRDFDRIFNLHASVNLINFLSFSPPFRR